MIRIIFYLIVFMTTHMGITAQDSPYDKGMKKGLDLWQQGNPAEATQLFERIAAAEQDNWIPSYYTAYVNTMFAFNSKDLEKLTLHLEKAQKYVDQAMKASPDNPEVLVLQALIHTAWISYDGQTYGMKLAGPTTELHQRAMALAPENPRVVLANAEWNMGSARFFGKDTTPYCNDIAKALELFATFKSETPFHPSWGEKRAQQLVKECEAK
ncbi:tetratricopeptide repeat protein [Flavobacteriaceae bacterium M23B6Z8]